MAKEKVIGYKLVIKGAEKTASKIEKLGKTLQDLAKVADKLESNLGQSMGSAGDDTSDLLQRIKELERQLEKAKNTPPPVDPDTAQEAVSEYDKLVAKIEELKNSGADNSKEYRELRKILKSGAADGTDLYDQLIERTAELKAQQDSVNKEIRDQARAYKANEFAIDSYRGINQELGKLRAQWRDLSKEERQANQGMLERIAELDSEVKSLDEEMGIYVRNVGNYKSAMQGLGEGIESLGVPISAVKQGFNTLAKNPLLAAITLLIGAVSALFGAFKQTREGAQAFAVASGLAEAAMGELAAVARSLFKAIQGIFEDPVGAIKSFGQSALESFKSFFIDPVLDSLGAIGRGLKALWDGDFDALKKAGADFAEAGTRNFRRVIQGAEDLGEAVRGTTRDIGEQAKAFVELELAGMRLAKVNRDRQKAVENLITAEELARGLTNDRTISLQEQQEALDEANKLLIQRAGLQVQIARDEFAQVQQRRKLLAASGRDTSQIQEQELEAYRSLAEAQRELTLAQSDNATRRREIIQDEAELSLDVLIDGLNNQAAINFDRIKDERRSLEERREILAETVRISDASFRQQVSVFQEFAKEKIDAQALLEAADARELDRLIKQTGLSEQLRVRLLESVRDRRDLEQEFDNQEDFLDVQEQEKRARDLEASYDDLLAVERMKLNEGIIQQQQFNSRSIAIQIRQVEEEIATLEMTEAEKRDKERELQVLRSEQIKANYEEDLSLLEQKNQDELNLIQKKMLEEQLLVEQQVQDGTVSGDQGAITQAQIEAEAQQLRLEQERQFLMEKAALLEAAGLSTVALEAEIAQKQLEIARGKNDQILANEERTKEQQQAISEARLGLLETLVSGTKDLLGQDEENRKKYGGILKALALGEIAINLIREISAINAANSTYPEPIGSIVKGATIAKAVVTAGIATAKVLKEDFAEGGAVGGGGGNSQGGQSGASQATASSTPAATSTVGQRQVSDDSSGMSSEVLVQTFPKKPKSTHRARLSRIIGSGRQSQQVPVKEGVLQGPPHSQGGIPFTDDLGNLYEAEGGEMLLTNGREVYFINKKSTQLYGPELTSLIGTQGPEKRIIASAVNERGGGVRFDDGGAVFNLGGVFSPIQPATPPAPQEILLSSDSAAGAGLGDQTQQIRGQIERGVADIAASAGSQKVYADASEIYRIGQKTEQSRRTRRL